MIQPSHFSFPENCAIGAVNVSSDKNARDSTLSVDQGGKLSNMAVVCVACLPGYKPRYYSDENRIVVECTKIQFCEGFDWFNGCSRCQKGYSYIVSHESFEYDTCLKSDENCLVQNPMLKKCEICQKGFFINYDDICEKLVVDNCLDPLHHLQQSVLLQNIGVLLHFKFNTTCQKCSKEYYPKRLL